MKIAVAEKRPYPVWLNGLRGGVSYYRETIPARMTNGREVKSLLVSVNGGSCRAVKISELLKTISSASRVCILGLGSPTLISFKDLMDDIENASALLRALRAAGVRVLIDLDDSILDWPAQLAWAVDLAGREEFFKRVAVELPSVTQAQLEAGWQEQLKTALPAIAAEKIRPMVGLAKLCKYFIVATRAVSESMRKHCGPALEIKICPNSIDLQDFRDGRSTRTSEAPIRVGYVGTFSHRQDIKLAWPGLLECARLPNVELHLFGWTPHADEEIKKGPHACDRLTPGKYEYENVPFVYHGVTEDTVEFHRRIAIFDIAVAPLMPNAFNSGKSPQKWFEHSVHGTAMVVSDSPAYECVEHGVTGFKASSREEFTHYLLMLARSADLRERIGEAARNAVTSRYTVDQWRACWQDAVDSLAA